MKFYVVIEGREYQVEVVGTNSGVILLFDGKKIEADIEELPVEGLYHVIIGGKSYLLGRENRGETVRVESCGAPVEVVLRRAKITKRKEGEEESGRKRIVSPLSGLVVEVLKHEGDKVEEGEGVVVMESMKMRNVIKSPASGVLKELRVREGDPVKRGDLLGVVEIS